MTDSDRPPAPTRPSVLRTRLRGGLVAQVTWEGRRRELVVRGVRSEVTLRALSSALASWRTFDRYDRVSLDLSTLPGLSPELAESLAHVARRAAAEGRHLGFLPPLDAARRLPYVPTADQRSRAAEPAVGSPRRET
jgi:hypothetical protein